MSSFSFVVLNRVREQDSLLHDASPDDWFMVNEERGTSLSSLSKPE